MQNTGDTEVYFTVAYGGFLVTINGQDRLVKESKCPQLQYSKITI